jgi:hypothetical protein
MEMTAEIPRPYAAWRAQPDLANEVINALG